MDKEKLTEYSLRRSYARLLMEKNYSTSKTVSYISPIGSQVCDSRNPWSCCISDRMIGIAGWSGEISTYHLPNLLLSRTLTGHTDRVLSLDFGECPISSSFDTTIGVWGESPLFLQGHTDRVNQVKWHAMSPYICSCSHDKTWGLWDAVSQKRVLSQEGHTSEVYCLDLHPDGSLIATGDLGGIGMVWDIRLEKQILILKGHIKGILALSFHPNGYLIASGSQDNTVKFWDLRKRGLVYTIPAHTNLVSAVALRMNVLVTASYDCTLKIWSLKDFSLMSNFENQEKFNSVGTSESYLAATSADRTVKLWSIF